MAATSGQGARIDITEPILRHARLAASRGVVRRAGGSTTAGEPEIVLGNVAHPLVEDALRGCITKPDDVEPRFDQVLHDAEAALPQSTVNSRWVPLHRFIPQFFRFKMHAITAARVAFISLDIVARNASEMGATRRLVSGQGPEIGIVARDGQAKERIDEVVLTTSGPLLRDLKTGAPYAMTGDVRRLKPTYREQMHVYAAMYAEDAAAGGGAWPDRLELVALTGDVAAVEFDPASCTSPFDDAIGVLQETNEIIATRTDSAVERAFASPTPDICR